MYVSGNDSQMIVWHVVYYILAHLIIRQQIIRQFVSFVSKDNLGTLQFDFSLKIGYRRYVIY